MVFFTIMRDYHVHTSYCKHASGEMEEYVLAAIEMGIPEICFTDHIPLSNGEDPEHRMAIEELEPYLEKVAILNRKYREISVLAGIEADYVEGYETYLKEFLAGYHFDLVIMSVHFIRHWQNEQWVFNFEYSAETIPQQYHDYFQAMHKGIETGLFDVVGHLDIIKRPGFPVLDTNREDVEKVLTAVKKKGMSIELNTSGLRKPISEIYPAIEIVKMAIKKDIPFTTASDAHQPQQVGYYFDLLTNHLFNYNGLKLAHYNKRKCFNHVLAPKEIE